MSSPQAQQRWHNFLSHTRAQLRPPEPVVEGKLTHMIGLTLEAVGCQAAVGSRCQIVPPSGREIEAEVVGFARDKTFLMPTSEIHGLVPGARVVPSGRHMEVPVGDALLGRVIDGAGKPMDGKGPLRLRGSKPLIPPPINPLLRRPIREPLDVGIRSINSLLTVGRGQRMGLFAGSGVGKSVLLGMMTKATTADVTVVGLIGERGREVSEFIHEILGEDGLTKAVVVAVPADESPLKRLHGALLATSIAEYFRDQGKDVLLLVDSLSRYAQAQREISLAIGEPPATKGYPPSVFAKLPQLVERAGNAEDGNGSITAFYTVLAEGDDQNDPIVDSARAVLDGHIVLSRSLAEAGHYPAIDIEASVSRLMNNIVNDEQRKMSLLFRKHYSTYKQNEDLINVGIYQPGTNPEIDRAIEVMPHLQRYLQQGFTEQVYMRQALAELKELLRDDLTELMPRE